MALGTYPPITLPVNKFIGTMSNLVGIVQTADTLEEGTIGQIIRACEDVSIPNGDGKMILSTDVLAVEDLPTTSTLLTSKVPTIKEQYIKVDNYKVVQMTINRYLMRGAFLSEGSMSGFIAYLYHMMRKTKEIYLYNLIVGMYDNYTPTLATQTKTVDLIDVSAAAIANDPTKLRAAQTENSNRVYKALINTLIAMGVPTKAFNDLELTEIIDKKSLMLIENAYFGTEMLVDTIASLLNSYKITDALKWGETIVLPPESFKTANQKVIIGWLAHKKKIQFGYFYNVSTSFFDASTLNLNNWLHFSYYIDEVDALPIVVFKANYVAPTAA